MRWWYYITRCTLEHRKLNLDFLLSVSLPVLCIQTTCGGFMIIGDDLYKRRKIKHYTRSRGANYFRVSGAFAAQFEHTKWTCVYYLCIRIQNPFSVSIFCFGNSLIFSPHSFSLSLDSVQVAPHFFHICVFFFPHSHTDSSGALSPAVRPNKNANLIK